MNKAEAEPLPATELIAGKLGIPDTKSRSVETAGMPSRRMVRTAGSRSEVELRIWSPEPLRQLLLEGRRMRIETVIGRVTCRPRQLFDIRTKVRAEVAAEDRLRITFRTKTEAEARRGGAAIAVVAVAVEMGGRQHTMAEHLAGRS